MKILPDYLIQYMPEIEEALEELRLSIIDHAYDLLKSLDIDELTTDNIKDKLRIFDIALSNISNEWLPNGKFYRLYPYIKHNRSRLNAISAIAKSGGQFESLWSDDFRYKPLYNFYKVGVGRHYQLKSDNDGYFYVSGDVTRDVNGRVISSAVNALSTDILINQSLPAGYTFLYVPWPRPAYPTDVGYFYNVHMLDFDRLHYARKWDGPVYDGPDYNVPASTKYRWYDGSNTPYRTPYWFDYHYMDDMRTDLYYNIWPITESGSYYDADGYLITSDKKDAAVSYVLDDRCKELCNSHAVFPTKFYTHGRYKTTMPCRDQYFTPLDNVAKLFLESYDETRKSEVISKLTSILSISAYDAQTILDNVPCKIDGATQYNIAELKDELELLGCVVRNITIDSNCLTDIYNLYKETPSSYRFDHLSRDYLLRLDHKNMHHIKTYKPFWNEKSPFFELCKSNYNPESVQYTTYRLKLLSASPTIGRVSFIKFVRSLTNNRIGLAEAKSIVDNIPCDINYDLGLQHKILLESVGCSVSITSTSTEEIEVNKKLILSSANSNVISRFNRIYNCYNIDFSYITLPIELVATETMSLEQIKDELDSLGATSTLIKTSAINKRSLYNWINLKQDNNIINADLYDSMYNEYTETKYKLYVKSLVESPDPLSFVDLAEAIFWVTGTRISSEPPSTSGMFISYIDDPNKLSAIDDEIRETYGYISDWQGNGHGAPHLYEFYTVTATNTVSKSVVKENIPPISEITHTSYDRATISKLDRLYVGYTRSASDSQGDMKYLRQGDNHLIYALDETVSSYNPELFYTVINFGLTDFDDYSQQGVANNNCNITLKCSPSDRTLHLTHSSNNLNANYITYKSSPVHKLYFSQDKADVSLNSNTLTLYNKYGDSEIYHHNGANNRSFLYNTLGIYNSKNELVHYDTGCNLKCVQIRSGNTYKYNIICDQTGMVDTNIKFTPDFNNSWRIAYRDVYDYEDRLPIQELGDQYIAYRSFSNIGVDDSVATMFINVEVENDTTVTFKYMNHCQCRGNDYLVVSVDDVVKYDGESAAYTDNPVWVDLPITFTKGKHVIKLDYEKSDPPSLLNDCAYFAIPKPLIHHVEASYILFTSKIIDKPADTI